MAYIVTIERQMIPSSFKSMSVNSTDMIESHIQNSDCGIVFDEEAHFVD